MSEMPTAPPGSSVADRAGARAAAAAAHHRSEAHRREDGARPLEGVRVESREDQRQRERLQVGAREPGRQRFAAEGARDERGQRPR